MIPFFTNRLANYVRLHRNQAKYEEENVWRPVGKRVAWTYILLMKLSFPGLLSLKAGEKYNHIG